MAEPLNTGLSPQQVLTAFDRALNDYTDAEIDALLTAKQDALTFDSAPTEDSTNPVTSGGVKTALATKQDSISDLAAIRSGAAAGATAVQQTAFEADQQRQDSEIGTVAEQGKSSYDFIFGLGTALQPNSDLDDYKVPGKVQAANGAIAATIANTPWTQSGFTAFIIPNLTPTSCMQFVLPNTMAGKWYRRRYMQNTWSPWTEYDGTEVTTT